jgi:hypothetical protein
VAQCKNVPILHSTRFLELPIFFVKRQEMPIAAIFLSRLEQSNLQGLQAPWLANIMENVTAAYRLQGYIQIDVSSDQDRNQTPFQRSSFPNQLQTRLLGHTLVSGQYANVAIFLNKDF